MTLIQAIAFVLLLTLGGDSPEPEQIVVSGGNKMTGKRTIKRLKRSEELYLELIYAVEHKFPDETRHQTALRYIREVENKVCEPAKEAV